MIDSIYSIVWEREREGGGGEKTAAKEREAEMHSKNRKIVSCSSAGYNC